MKKYLVLLLGVLLQYSCQNKGEKLQDKDQTVLKSYASYYPSNKTKVLVVGTFHFSYPGLDYTKTEENDKIDVLKEPKKSEVTELVEYIKKFKPTKVAIEAKPSWNMNQRYKEYKKGEHRNERGEDFQLGMRIANDFNLDSIYSIDANTLSSDLSKLNSEFIEELSKDYDFKSDDPYNEMVQKSFDEDAKMPSKVNLLEYFKHMNSIEGHKNNYGAYLVGDFKLDDNRGADFLSIWWYNRNLRIFRNIQKIDHANEDRVLVIIGNGHASLLRHMIEYSPEYEFVEFDSL
ncbi:DUF5694 domain-containing protein [Tenacibaculum sp. Ill]|uniref:DUF5694 domain-containing protein n=1 Tax=Tenacibaculum sp. Ill TaxID=3445935 RepID=UPI003F7A67AE